MADMKMDLSDRIVVSRRKAKKLQNEIAEEIALATSTLSRYEKGVIEPPIGKLLRIARATDNPDLLDLRWMYEDDEDEPSDEGLSRSGWMAA